MVNLRKTNCFNLFLNMSIIFINYFLNILDLAIRTFIYRDDGVFFICIWNFKMFFWYIEHQIIKKIGLSSIVDLV